MLAVKTVTMFQQSMKKRSHLRSNCVTYISIKVCLRKLSYAASLLYTIIDVVLLSMRNAKRTVKPITVVVTQLIGNAYMKKETMIISLLYSFFFIWMLSIPTI